MTDEERQIEAEAIQYAKENRTQIARRLTDLKIFPAELRPASVFMAGSPGAGKTEASIVLLEEFWKTDGVRILRVDPDDLRKEIPGYNGRNSWLFQRAVTPIVERIHDLALKQSQSFLLDGTLSNFDVACRNIERSLNKGRVVQILYVYQEPRQAWAFVQARERVEGRNIPLGKFIEQYFAARNVVNQLKLKYRSEVKVDLLLKNNDGTHRQYRAGVDQIDNHIPEKYDPPTIAAMLARTDQ